MHKWNSLMHKWNVQVEQFNAQVLNQKSWQTLAEGLKTEGFFRALRRTTFPPLRSSIEFDLSYLTLSYVHNAWSGAARCS